MHRNWSRAAALCVTVSALALFGPAGVPGAQATPVEYQFVDASVTLDTSYTINGTFDFDAGTGTQSNVSIILSGTGGYAGTYTAAGAVDDSANPYVVESLDASLDLQMEIVFGAYFAGSSQTLTGVGFYTNYTSSVIAPPVDYACGEPYACAGSAYANEGSMADPVPEPSSGSLSAAALGLMLFARWRTQRRRLSGTDGLL